MNKDKILKSLDILGFCSLGDRNRVLKRLGLIIPKTYSSNISLCISYLNIREELEDLGLTLPELTTFLFKGDGSKSLKYLSFILENGHEDLLAMVLSIRNEAITSNKNNEIKLILSSEYESLETTEDVIIFYYVLISSKGGRSCTNDLINIIKNNCRSSLSLIRNKVNTPSWYCSINVLNNYQEITKLEKEKSELEEMLRAGDNQ